MTKSLNVLEFTDLNSAQIQLVKDTICKGATDEELALFLFTAKRTGLDPLAKQCWAVKRWNSELRRMEMTFQTSIDGFRVIAQRSGQYQGQEGPYWCGLDGKWTDIWLGNDYPIAAKVGVFREGFKGPIWGIAKFDSYVGKKKDGEITQMWKTLPDHMIAKIAEALALRKAFPNDLSGVLSDDETIEHEIELAPDGNRPPTQGNENKTPPQTGSSQTERHQPVGEGPKPIVNHAPVPEQTNIDNYALDFNFGTFKSGTKIASIKISDLRNLQTAVMSWALKMDGEGKPVPPPIHRFIEVSKLYLESKEN